MRIRTAVLGFVACISGLSFIAVSEEFHSVAKMELGALRAAAVAYDDLHLKLKEKPEKIEFLNDEQNYDVEIAEASHGYRVFFIPHPVPDRPGFRAAAYDYFIERPDYKIGWSVHTK